MTSEQSSAVGLARALTRLGVPIFVASPDPTSRLGFRLPPAWQQTPPNPGVLDAWQPGMALGMVTGHGLDLIDIDPRNGGHHSALQGRVPKVYAIASTPSGGAHLFVRSLGVRSRDGVLPGIDVKAGRDGEGHGFAFIAPTVRTSKGSGEPRPYVWEQADLPALAAVLEQGAEDHTGQLLARLVEERHQSPSAGQGGAEAYDGPPFDQLPPDEQARIAALVAATVQGIVEDLRAAGEWPEGHTDERGRGWEKLQAGAAWRLSRLARATWNDLELADAEAAFLAHAPTGGGWSDSDVRAKWALQSSRGEPAPYPLSEADRDAASWEALGVQVPELPAAGSGQAAPGASPPAAVRVHNPKALQDAHLAETVADRVLRGRYCWSGALGWMRYGAGCWTPIEEPHVHDVVRRDLLDQHAREATAGADAERLKRLSATLSAARIRGLTSLARGIVGVEAGAFDRHPDLLCVGNGVVDLRTGELGPHDAQLLLTKRTAVDYVAGARSTDWDAALAALPHDVVGWVQLRLGQAATGYRTSDDVLPVFQGSGSNGKTTLIGTVVQALGDHAVTIPERVLMAHPSDHPTELMTLRGARLAVIEETPEGRRLSTKRLKDTLGTPTLTARAIRRDNVTWTTTHSLLLTTNYQPIVSETDHGTWRRLSLIRFPFTFVPPGQPADEPHKRPSLPGIRERLWEGRDGSHEAALAWVVAGARAWYAADRIIPPAPSRVARDTAAWREESDLVLAYVTERLVIGPAAAESHVLSSELFADFAAYVGARGHQPWAEKTFVGRFAEHETVADAGVVKRRMRASAGLSRPTPEGPSLPHAPTPPQMYTAWMRVRFRPSSDDFGGAVVRSVAFGGVKA